MMKKGHSRLVCLLLALLLTQNLALPVYAALDDGIVLPLCDCGGSGYEEIPIVFATCRTPGSKGGFRCSSCGKILREPEYSEVENHDEYLVTVEGYPSTCTEQGKTDGCYCSLCNEVWDPQESLPLAAHTPVDDPAVSATCTTPGKTAGSHCSVCNTVLTAQEEIPATGHKKAVTVPAKAATCIENGCTEGWKCDTCGYTEASKVLPTAGHTKETIPAKAATCTESGLTEGAKCSVCGEILTPQTELPTAGHTVQIDARVANTCTTPGKTQGSHCAVCGVTLEAQQEISPMGHAYEKRAGKAPTCGAPGRTDYYRCVDCGELLNAQTLPATGIHQFVPVSGDPNDGYSCQVCGKSDTGLTQDGSYPLLPYEKEDGTNGFLLSNGEAPAKSAQLQVYRNEEGNYVNVLCLTWEDGTMTYVSFETGTANIGELLTIYLQNAKDAGTREKLEAASQPNFGVGFDENGNPYLYVIQDGTKYAFMVSEPVVETVEIVFGTKDVTTTEETQATEPIQKYEEQKEEQTTDKTDDDTTDNTFVIHKFVEPEEEEDVEEEAEIDIPYHKKRSAWQDRIPESSPCTAENHKGILDYFNDDHHKCRSCNLVFLHTGFQNGVFTCCDGKCTHSRWNATIEHCVCVYCGITKEHNFVDKGSGCECSVCNIYYTKHSHDGVNDSCSRCGHVHSWTEVDGKVVCQTCQLKINHLWKQRTDYCECSFCGKTLAHKYEDGLCSRCGYQCSHSWRNRNGVNICYDCQMTEVHDWQERDGGCRCTNCGETRSHDYKDGSCVNCGYKCPHPDGLKNGACAVCGYTCSHDHGWARKNGDVCVCKKCRMEEAHHWRRFGGFYICSKCGAFSTKKKP